MCTKGGRYITRGNNAIWPSTIALEFALKNKKYTITESGISNDYWGKRKGERANETI